MIFLIKKTKLSLFFLLFLVISKVSSAQNMNGFADIIDDILPAAVSISTSGEVANGSGFIVSNDGYIVTNNHVIENSGEISITLHDGTKYKPKIIGVDQNSDIAVLKINTNKNLTTVKFGDSAKMRIGDLMIVIGNPYGLGLSASTGILSALNRGINNGQSNDYFQTDAAINKGSSGGPVFNTKGELIGISTALFSPSGGSVGISFVYPSSLALPIIAQIKDQGRVTHAWIGISIQELSDEMSAALRIQKSKGAFVTDVTKEGPAEKAGIKPADIIVKFGDQEIMDIKTLPQLVSQTAINKNIAVTVLRRGKIRIMNVKVLRNPSDM